MHEFLAFSKALCSDHASESKESAADPQRNKLFKLMSGELTWPSTTYKT
jgi:hypothetical protein